MSKKRSLDTQIRLDEDFADLSYRQRDLWHGLISVADDQGRLPGHPGAVRSLIWPMDTVSIDDVRNDLEVLASEKHGYVHLYDSGGKSYIQIVNWWKHQTMQWAGPSGYPAPEGWLDRCRYHGKKHKVVTINWDTPGGFCVNLNKEDVNVKDNVNVNPDLSPFNKADFKALNPPPSWQEKARKTMEFACGAGLLPSAIPLYDCVYSLIEKYGEQETKDALKLSYTKWKNTKSKNTGKFYYPTNYEGWVGWAVIHLTEGREPWLDGSPVDPAILKGLYGKK